MDQDASSLFIVRPIPKAAPRTISNTSRRTSGRGSEGRHPNVRLDRTNLLGLVDLSCLPRHRFSHCVKVTMILLLFFNMLVFAIQHGWQRQRARSPHNTEVQRYPTIPTFDLAGDTSKKGSQGGGKGRWKGESAGPCYPCHPFGSYLPAQRLNAFVLRTKTVSSA
ncbi:hypothetical protein EDB89DRAFT_640707 [Lactarius sanguifluus]|nr:hypothetical protein EDB89DRAFT_640707 [Lactarius sanguifluus]